MELWPFVIVGALAVVAAVMMLLSENAVHSALFLILNMACIAFLFLTLNAPFLAMIQITVYAGAIMVLFLFVIMLLGAEKLLQAETRFRWLPTAATVLAVLFLLITGLALLSGQITLQPSPSQQPVIRAVNVAPDVGPMDVYANGELIASNLGFRQSTDFVPLAPGDYTIGLRPAGLGVDLVTATVTVASSAGDKVNAYTAIVYGEGPLPVLNILPDDINTLTDRGQSRVAFFNGYPKTVNVTDFGSEFDRNDDRNIVADLAPGSESEPQLFEETDVAEWAFVDAATKEVVYRLNNPDIFRLRSDNSQLVILTAERLFDGSTRALAHTLSIEALPAFGEPKIIGQQLFTRYLLPFEMVSVLLLVAMIGAIVLTQREHVPAIRRRDIRRKVSRPLTSVIAAQTGHEVTNGQAQPEERPEPVGK